MAPRALSIDQWNDCLDRIRDAHRNFEVALRLLDDPDADEPEVVHIIVGTVDAALLVLGEIQDVTEETEGWVAVEDAIRELDLEWWLRPVLLERAIDTARKNRA